MVVEKHQTHSLIRPIPLDQFVRQQIPRKEWAIENIWPKRAKGIIAAPPKNGKSTISVELAVSLATATPFLGVDRFRCAERAKVTYVHQGENSIERIRKDFDSILIARGLGYMEEVLTSPPMTVNEERASRDLPALDGPDGEQLYALGERFEPTWGGLHGHPVPDLDVLVNPGLTLGSRGGEQRPGVDAHREQVEAYALERDYLILDPVYMLAGISTNDEAAVIDLVGWLSKIHDAGCSVIFTHQQSKYSKTGENMTGIMGSTFLPAWYETAIYPKRTGGFFEIHVDNLREMGTELDLSLEGQGTGRWLYAEAAQDVTDSSGRRAPNTAKKEVRKAKFQGLILTEPDLTDAELGIRLGVTSKTIQNYKRDFAKAAAEVTVENGED